MNAATSKIMTKGTLLTGLFLSLALAVGVAHAAFKGAGKMTFEATGDGIDMKGNGPLRVSEDVPGQIVISVPIDKIDTGMTLRNTHMVERLKGKRHPAITLTVARSALKLPEAGKSVSGKVDGKLKFAGVEKPASVEYTATQAGNAIKVKGKLKTNVYAHGIEKGDICQIGVCAAPELKIEAEFSVSE
jgi:polyisoprenoid-binding protein YceI